MRKENISKCTVEAVFYVITVIIVATFGQFYKINLP